MSGYYSIPIPGVDLEEPLPGKLIVLEGTDGVGRSTQLQLLRNWLESSGLAVYDTGLTRGQLAGRHIQEAKEGHTMGRRTQCLYYASDFADRLETEMIPALKAGYVVLTDRYIYSLMARAAVRGIERSWLRTLYGFALRPDLVLYLRVSLEKLLPRVLASGGFDYWESGMDYSGEESMYDSFIKHQRAVLQEFDTMAKEYEFVVMDANRGVRAGFNEVRRHVEAVVGGMTPSPAPATIVDFAASLRPLEEPRTDRRSVTSKVRELLWSLFEDADE